MDPKIEDSSNNQPGYIGEGESQTPLNQIHGTPIVKNDQILHTRTSRLDFPRFDGTDATGWICRAEQFFLHQQTQTLERLLMASFHVEGKALQWV